MDKWLAQSLIFVFLFLALGLGAIVLRYGTLTTAAAVLSGDDLIVAPQTVDLGQVQRNTPISFEVSVRNESTESVSILGVDSCCFCKLVSKSPIIILPRKEQTLQLEYFATGGNDEAFRVSVPLITTSQTSHPMLELVGVFSEAVSAPTDSSLLTEH